MFKNLKKFLATIFSITFIVNFMGSFVFADGYGNMMLIGNFSGGKTEIFRWYRDLPFVGLDSERSKNATHVILNLKESGTETPVATVRFYDTPGADVYYDAVVEMASICHVVIVVHDMTQCIDEEIGKKNIEYFRKLYKDLHARMVSGGVIIFAGSKVDLKHSSIDIFAKNRRMLLDVAEALDCKCFFTSAKTGEGLRELMEYVTTSFTKMTLPQKDVEDKFNVYELIPDPSLIGGINLLNEEVARLKAEKATIIEEKNQALADKEFYKKKKEELESSINTLKSHINKLDTELKKSNKKRKTAWDYIPIIGSFNFK